MAGARWNLLGPLSSEAKGRARLLPASSRRGGHPDRGHPRFQPKDGEAFVVALQLFHLFTSSFCARSAKMECLVAARFFSLTGFAGGDGDASWSWGSHLRLGRTCVALLLDCNESFGG